MSGRTTTEDGPEIHRALTRLRDTTGLPLTFGGPVNAARQMQLSEFAGAIAGALRGVVLDFGLGLGGKVVALRRPLVVNDYVRTPGISHHYDHIITAEGLRAMVAAPVVVGRIVRGVLYGAVRNAAPLGDRLTQSVADAARDLEQTLVIKDALARCLERLDDHTTSERPTERSSPQWELVREAYAELRVLAQDTGDELLRERMETVCTKLAAVGMDTAPGFMPTPKLSARELDVLACVALGWTNAQVAADLGVRTETVKSYLRSAMSKLGSRSRREAVVTARRHGLLP